MLGDCNVCPEIAVKDLAIAKSFYGDTLGLNVVSENSEEILFQSGACNVSVYRSQFAGTNQATYASFKTDDVASKVEALKAKGVTFEHYDMPGMSLEGDVHVMGDMQAAWFKDPDGNILCVANMRKD